MSRANFSHKHSIVLWDKSSTSGVKSKIWLKALKYGGTFHCHFQSSFLAPSASDIAWRILESWKIILESTVCVKGAGWELLQLEQLWPGEEAA